MKSRLKSGNLLYLCIQNTMHVRNVSTGKSINDKIVLPCIQYVPKVRLICIDRELTLTLCSFTCKWFRGLNTNALHFFNVNIKRITEWLSWDFLHLLYIWVIRVMNGYNIHCYASNIIMDFKFLLVAQGYEFTR